MTSTLEERVDALREGRLAIEAKFQHMQSLFTQMNAIGREKLSGYDLETPTVALASVLDYVPPSGIRIENSNALGRCCVIESHHDSGDMIFSELPCIVLPVKCSMPGEKEDLLQVWKEFTPIQVTLLDDFEVHLESAPAEERDRLLLSEQEVLDISANGVEIREDSLLRLRMVDRVNAHRFGLGAALFRTASKVEHSCQPNCRVVENAAGIEVRALRKIKAGDRISFSYIADEALLFSETSMRQQYLREKHYFHCLCDRCCAEDQARSFRCPCGGDISISIEEGSASIEEERWYCERCGYDSSLIATFTLKERNALKLWREMRAIVGRPAARLASPEEFVGLWLQRACEQDDIEAAAKKLGVQMSPNYDLYDCLQMGLSTLREDLLAFAPRHWLVAHAALFAGLLMLGRVAHGYLAQGLEEVVTKGVREFVQLAARLFADGSYVLEKIVKEVRSMIRDASIGRLGSRFAVWGGVDLIPNESATSTVPNYFSLMEMD